MKKALLLLVAGLAAGVPARADVIEYYHVDAIGNVRAVTDGDGNVLERHDYLPFGEEWNAPTSTQPRRFTGKERDAETGLDYFGARYFFGSAGRFTSVDPKLDALHTVANPQQWNRYAYVSNNPLKFADPDGSEQVVILGGKTYMGGVDGESAGSKQDQQNVFEVFTGTVAIVAGTVIVIGPGGVVTVVRAAGVAATTWLAHPENQATIQETLEEAAGGSPGKVSPLRSGRSVTERLVQHTTRDDLVAAAREASTGKPYMGQHLKEVREAARGLRIRINQIKNGLSDPNLPSEVRESLSRELSLASKNLDAAEDAIKGKYVQHGN